MSDRKMLECAEAIRLLVEYLDNELSTGRRDDLERHLEMCRSCHARHEFEKGLKDQIAGLGRETIRPEFRNRILSLVDRFPYGPGEDCEPAE
jgi:anti-sigma factor (TIGR02949 family)